MDSFTPVPRIPSGKYLTVVLAGESYGINLLNIREVIRPQSASRVTPRPDGMQEAIQLRGWLVPLLDLRGMFGLRADFTERTRIVVVRVKLTATHIVQRGLIVDEVEEIVSLARTEIVPPAGFDPCPADSCSLRLAADQGRIKAILDLGRVIAAGRLPVAFQAA